MVARGDRVGRGGLRLGSAAHLGERTGRRATSRVNPATAGDYNALIGAPMSAPAAQPRFVMSKFTLLIQLLLVAGFYLFLGR